MIHSAFRRFGSPIGFLPLLILQMCALSAVAFAQTDEFVAKLNNRYSDTLSAERRSDLIILPLVAKMRPPPPNVADLKKAELIPADHPGFAACRVWAEEAEQQAIIRAVSIVGNQEKAKNTFVWGLRYGLDRVPLELIEANLYTDLGDPPTLASARHLWIPAMDQVAVLVNIEATRLASDGKVSEAISMLLNWVILCRQIAEREFFAESKWGLFQIVQAFERVRDVAHTDLMGVRALDLKLVPAQVSALALLSPFDVSRMAMPVGDTIAAEQLNARLFDLSLPKQPAIPDVFAPTMARIVNMEMPLRRLTEAGRWRTLAQDQADGWDTRDAIKLVHEDFAIRWSLPWFDRIHYVQCEFDKVQPQFSVLIESMHDIYEIFWLREQCRVEMIGTQVALAIVAEAIAAKSLPLDLSGARPQWITKLPGDPLQKTLQDNSEGGSTSTINKRETGQRGILKYFVPMRRTLGASKKEAPKPHAMEILHDGSPFTRKFDDTEMILYSVGMDNSDNSARRIQNALMDSKSKKPIQDTDYLIWPPVLSMYRKNLRDAELPLN